MEVVFGIIIGIIIGSLISDLVSKKKVGNLTMELSGYNLKNFIRWYKSEYGEFKTYGDFSSGSFSSRYGIYLDYYESLGYTLTYKCSCRVKKPWTYTIYKDIVKDGLSYLDVLSTDNYYYSLQCRVEMIKSINKIINNI